MVPILALLFLPFITDAEVSFKSSIIYDEYDLEGSEEIPLKSLSHGGCSVFVSVPTWNIDSTKNIFVYNHISGFNVSLYSTATGVDKITWAKTGLHLSSTDYSIMNYNTKSVGPIVIYVVGSQAKYYGDKEVEIYDAVNINMRPVQNKKMTMILSAEPFNLFVQAYGNNLNAFVRTTGFDNNYQRESDDDCRIIYEQNEDKPFRIRINSPILTINFDGQSNYQICAKIDNYNGALLDYSGTATSQGYVGCSANWFQNYRSSIYNSSVFELRDDKNIERKTQLTYVVNTKNTDKVSFTTFNNGGSDSFDVMGDGNTEDSTIKNAYKINIELMNNYGSSYWVGYSSQTGVISVPTGYGICTNFIETTTADPTTSLHTEPSQLTSTTDSNEFSTTSDVTVVTKTSATIEGVSQTSPTQPSTTPSSTISSTLPMTTHSTTTTTKSPSTTSGVKDASITIGLAVLLLRCCN